MRSRIHIALIFSFQLAVFSAASAQDAGDTGPEGGCDTGRNLETWYLKYRECGPKTGQASLLANISGTPVEGGQYSFFMNVAVEEVKGTQLSGSVNFAKHAHNQISLDLNLAKTVDGFQFSAVNIADSVKGSQIGFLNVARNLDGLSLAFLTFAGNGLFHLDASAEETGMSSLAFASGKGLFTSYSFGFTPAEASHPYAFGMGFGYNHAIAKSYLEGEIRAHLVLDRYTERDELEDVHKGREIGDSDWRHNTLVQAKVRAGTRLFGSLGVFGGVSYNALATHGNERLMAPWTDELTHNSKEEFGWPGVEIGIRLGR